MPRKIKSLAKVASNRRKYARGTVYSIDHIAEAAFQYFRKAGFPYRHMPVHMCQQEINTLADTEDDKLIKTNVGTRIADTYHPHRYHGHANGMHSPVSAFNNDYLLKRAIKVQLESDMPIGTEYFSTLNIVSGTQANSNFRPGLSLYIYRRFCPKGAVILDTSTGYGGRLVGFVAFGQAQHYIGIDPSTLTHAGNLRMAADLGVADRVTLINLPAEDVPHKKLANKCDFAFTSPPYFVKEHYADEDTQSSARYPKPLLWKERFLQKMFDLQFASLKKEAYNVVNIADVVLDETRFPLVDWAIECATKSGFIHADTDAIPLTRRFGRGNPLKGRAEEPLLVFRKP